MVSFSVLALTLGPALSFLSGVVVQASPVTNTTVPNGRRATYTNPILGGGGADPWVLEYNNYYYLLITTGGDIQVRKSSSLSNFNVSPVVVWSPSNPATQKDIWAPELHNINGQFYIYAAMDDGNNSNHRMYVWQGTSTTDPTAPFRLVGKINTPDDNWAIDGTGELFSFPLQINSLISKILFVVLKDGATNYFIWSGWTDPSNTLWQNLYIAKMASPTALTGNRVLLHQPTPSWQKTIDGSGVHGINEGPEILVCNGRTFLIYSVAGSWTQDYALAFMGLNNNGDDPLNVNNWWTLDDRPVFWKSAANGVYGPGHASFPYDRNGVPYIVYHAMSDPNAGWNGRTVRTETYGYNPDGSPAFPTPHSLSAALPQPA